MKGLEHQTEEVVEENNKLVVEQDEFGTRDTQVESQRRLSYRFIAD